MKAEIKDLIKISHYAAASKAYIQGGGGNTSVKLDDRQMAVKASGCKLSDMSDAEGYVVVDYKSIAGYFAEADEKDEGFEKQSTAVLQASIIPLEGIKQLRPSVEAGFHSVLKKYVIHTHSVYTNILCCCAEGKNIAGKILKDVTFIWLPYVDPGAKLTLAITQAIKNAGSVPDIIFMQNHGVIVSADEADRAIELHEIVNKKTKEYFDITEEYPEVKLEVSTDGTIKSASPYAESFFADRQKDFDSIKQKVLYPDQLVYLNNSIFKNDGSESDLYFADNSLTYRIGEKQAMVNEETLVAYLYVIQMIEKLGLELVTMTYEQQAFILGWESEAYRRAMLK